MAPITASQTLEDYLKNGKTRLGPNLNQWPRIAGWWENIYHLFRGLASVGYNGAGSGEYARKHNPAANWMGTGTNQIPTSTNQPVTAFPTDYSRLPTVAFVVPNLIDDMHNGTIPDGDNWIENNITPYLNWAKTHNSLLILTWDEDETTTGGRIVTVFAGQSVKPGKYSETLNHYSVLRTMEDIYGLRHACNAATATAISDVWTAAGVAVYAEKIMSGLSSFPNPAAHSTELLFTLERGDVVEVGVFNVLGESVRMLKNERLDAGEHRIRFDRDQLPSGVYIAQI